jgi:hypothetical protein
MPRKPIGDRPLTGAEREARRRARVAEDVRGLRAALLLASAALASLTRDEAGGPDADIPQGSEHHDLDGGDIAADGGDHGGE